MNCKHPSLFNNMCVVCGMKVVPGAQASTNNATNASNSANGFKSLNMSGGKVLQLSAEEAASVTANKVNNLRNSKKLALVLDLDHTLLHAIQIEGQTPSRTAATARVIDGTTGAGSGNGTEDNVVHHLPIEEIDRFTVKHLVMKKRPHLDEFLERASEFCQMTVYTAGTRRYAEAVAKVIDPTRRYFGDRIVSRCDVANIRADGNDKSLERIFPGDASMAVIIDDREDVWRGPQGAQLLLVKPFVHFDPRPSEASAAAAAASAGAGAAQPDNAAAPPPDALSTISRGVSAPNPSSNPSSTAAPAVIMSPVITLCGSAATGEPAGRIAKVAPLYSFEHSSLDDQLPRCLQVLLEIHAQYYSNSGTGEVSKGYDESKSAGITAVALHTQVHTPVPPLVAPIVQQQGVGTILQDIKKKVLAGCTLTFSGLIPTNEENPRNHTLWRLAEALGAQVSTELLPRTTHLISIHTQTAKVTAVLQKRASEVWVLHPDWLIYCRWSLSRCCEATFMLNQLAPGQAPPNPVMDYTPLPPSALAITAGTAVPLTASVATTVPVPGSTNGGTSLVNTNASAITSASVVSPSGVSVPVTTSANNIANGDANSRKRGRTEDTHPVHHTQDSTKGRPPAPPAKPQSDGNDMLSALKRLKAVGNIGTSEKDMYSFTRKYAGSSGAGVSNNGASNGTNSSSSISMPVAVNPVCAVVDLSTSSNSNGTMRATAGSRSTLFAGSNTAVGNKSVTSTSAGAPSSATAPALQRPSTAVPGKIKKKAGPIWMEPVTPTEKGNDTSSRSSSSSCGDTGGTGNDQQGAPTSAADISNNVVLIVDAARLARKAQGKHSPVRSSITAGVTALGADKQQYFIQYDYENSGDRYFSLDNDDGADSNSDGGTDSTDMHNDTHTSTTSADAADDIAGMCNDNAAGYNTDHSTYSRGSNGSRSSRRSNSSAGNSSAGSGNHSLMGYEDQPEPDDDDDNMDMGDEGQCCNDDNGSTWSATLEQYDDTERALYPCSRGRASSRGGREATASRMQHQHQQLEDGELEDDDSTYNMPHLAIYKHKPSSSGSPMRSTNNSNASSSSSPIHNSSNTSVNSSEEDDDCSDFEVMINRRRRSASNTDTVVGNTVDSIGGGGDSLCLPVPASAPVVYVVDDDEGDDIGAVDSAVLDDAASAYSDMDDQLQDE